MEEQISKKELLKLTGISYGQLYRWKREKLIPEEWFMKQASSTGQETYFPKAQVLQRVERIKGWKDRYSLEEMAAMLSPEFIDRLFCEEELEQFTEIDIDVAAQFMDGLNKDEFTFTEIIWMIAISKLLQDHPLKEAIQEPCIKGLLPHVNKIASLEYQVVLIELQDTIVSMIYPTGHPPLMDVRMKIIKEVSLQELSQQSKEKYQDIFHFINE